MTKRLGGYDAEAHGTTKRVDIKNDVTEHAVWFCTFKPTIRSHQPTVFLNPTAQLPLQPSVLPTANEASQ
ncbi:MAG: hypothetical protein P8176_05635 [Gammaproteobacteria bacterium]